MNRRRATADVSIVCTYWSTKFVFIWENKYTDFTFNEGVLTISRSLMINNITVVIEAVKECKNLIILDRALSAGGPAGPVASEVKAALYNKSVKPAIVSIVGGLGGRDIHVSDFINMVDIGEKAIKNNDIKPFEIYGVRG